MLLISRYKLLESKLESTLKKSLEIKEEKIAALEARLEESTNLNQQLRQELKTVRRMTFFVRLNDPYISYCCFYTLLDLFVLRNEREEKKKGGGGDRVI